MPKLIDDTMTNFNTASNYGFSAVKLDELGACEYTLVTLVIDTSGSLYGFEKDLEKMIEETVNSCKKSPRAENLMIRIVTFNHNENELHGFKLLNNINSSDYNNTIKTEGMTLLIDSVYHSIESIKDYGKILVDQDYFANAIVVIMTDGMDNMSKYSSSSIKSLIDDTKNTEVLESITTILIGMGNDVDTNNYLSSFSNEASIDSYINMGDVTSNKLAKLAKFVSHSVSSTSQALGTGGPSKEINSLTF